ncbi:folylpolyglutamate /dihydrofolate synthase [Anaerolinea thermolimosa]|uniref:bifunctional folylpolyglutamate synthase/dihydrofolate synthase n=1 Tax=Anaerolinea thermolimosa TaxID=229919 RepID=UPI0007815B86|nr:folylpolyglutamate synthase/dihydrofolate synthase family protein [Anaerolinea thermolimosa]GAP06795.1 folylpolyglutamate /dihydrofolate synthase [Anaerolinea thermolimosa]
MVDEIAYQEALDYLYRFVDYSLTRNFRYTPEKFDLGRMHQLMHLLGDAHLQYPVIHVAGTKGKGSTAAMIASVLQSAGYRVGLYTSPHLQDYAERIQINRQPIDHDEFTLLVEEIKPKVMQVERLTTFEITTALAFLYFARNKCDIGVIEVGLGGRLDATNVVDPLVSVITSLSMDHMNVLGDTLGKIAAEKAGIVKPGKPLVLAPQREEARLVVRGIAEERKSPVVEVGQDYLFALRSRSLEGQTFWIWRRDEQMLVDQFIESGGNHPWQPMRLHIPLLGYHQVQNAATAFAALQVARAQGIEIHERAISDGFSSVFWPARFEILGRNPLLVVDSAHNRDSALKLRLTLDDYLPDKPIILLFGASEDKDIHGMFEELLPRVRRLIATQSVHPRAAEAEKLVELAHRFGVPAQALTPVEKALERALELAVKEEAAVVAAGSLFIAAAVREIWLKSRQMQPEAAK